MKSVMIGNTIIKSVFTICVTVAAMHFDKPSLLFWLVMLIAIGYDYKSTPSKSNSAKEGEKNV